jgi:hypothetical protein
MDWKFEVGASVRHVDRTSTKLRVEIRKIGADESHVYTCTWVADGLHSADFAEINLEPYIPPRTGNAKIKGLGWLFQSGYFSIAGTNVCGEPFSEGIQNSGNVKKSVFYCNSRGVMTDEVKSIRETIEIKRESIQLGWKDLAESMPTMTGQERYQRKSAIKAEIAELATLYDDLDAATPAPFK